MLCVFLGGCVVVAVGGWLWWELMPGMVSHFLVCFGLCSGFVCMLGLGGCDL